MLFCTRYGPSRVFTSRSASPSRRATSNIDVAFHRLSASSGAARALLEDVDRVLRDRQVARRQHDDHALAVARRTSASWRSARSGRRRRWCANPRRRSSRHRGTSRHNRSSAAGRRRKTAILPCPRDPLARGRQYAGTRKCRLMSSPSAEIRSRKSIRYSCRPMLDDVVGPAVVQLRVQLARRALDLAAVRRRTAAPASRR